MTEFSVFRICFIANVYFKNIYVFWKLILEGSRSYFALVTPFLFRQVGGKKIVQSMQIIILCMRVSFSRIKHYYCFAELG